MVKGLHQVSPTTNEVKMKNKNNNIINIKTKKNIKTNNHKNVLDPIEFSQDETFKFINKMQKKIDNPQDFFIGATLELIRALYYFAPSSKSATHLLNNSHRLITEELLELEKEENTN